MERASSRHSERPWRGVVRMLLLLLGGCRNAVVRGRHRAVIRGRLGIVMVLR